MAGGRLVGNGGRCRLCGSRMGRVSVCGNIIVMVTNKCGMYLWLQSLLNPRPSKEVTDLLTEQVLLLRDLRTSTEQLTRYVQQLVRCQEDSLRQEEVVGPRLNMIVDQLKRGNDQYQRTHLWELA